MFLTLKHTAPHRADSGQTVHVVDLENLAGEQRTPQAVRTVWRRYAAEMRIRPTDPVFIGCGPKMGRIALFALDTNARFFIKRGINGGEEALMEALDPRWLAQRYGRIVVASGDHAFADWIVQARLAGGKVHVVANYGSISLSLLEVCNTSTQLIVPTARMGWLTSAHHKTAQLGLHAA